MAVLESGAREEQLPRALRRGCDRHLRQLQGGGDVPDLHVDANGKKLDASKGHYTLRLAKDQLPPANAFWSLTMYELPSSLLVANPLNRYLINSPARVAGQGQGVQLAACTNGPFFTILRLYWPKEETLQGQWKAPQMHPVK